MKYFKVGRQHRLHQDGLASVHYFTLITFLVNTENDKLKK